MANAIHSNKLLSNCCGSKMNCSVFKTDTKFKTDTGLNLNRKIHHLSFTIQHSEHYFL